MTSTTKLGSALTRGVMILLAPVALIPLGPAIALMFLAKWLHAEKESPATCVQTYHLAV